MKYTSQYSEYMFFNNFLFCIFAMMPFVKKITMSIVDKNTDYHRMIERKINQYTNWNLFMILCNHFLNFNNIYISKFIAFNSLQICLIFHTFMLYDSRLLLHTFDQTKPIILRPPEKYNRYCIITEYIIVNFIIHLLPVYTYKDFLFAKVPYDNHMNMGIYAALFKFMWSLNVFGHFDVTSLYVPDFNYCSIKFFNMLIVSDYFMGVILDTYNHISSY
jgi:hypothetical protein